jgi:serine/threonine-protein kinase
VTTGTPETYADDKRRYLLRSRIATGGMGEVWRATDTTLGREVAVKLLKTEYADDPAFRSRFETEARHAAALHHPHIASVYDFGEAGATDGSGVPRPFLVMELVEGQPLSALLRPGTGLDPAPTRDLLGQAAEALGVAHAAGIVHRDVKPANLLVTPERQLKVTDFGIARATDGLGITQTGQVMGTPQYLSPEQARGETATPASDVYALGVVAFECLTGRRPFDKESPVATALAHLHDPVPPLPPEVPADLAGVVRRALAKDPAERYADGAALAAALRDPATDAATQVVLPPVTERTQVLGAPVPAPVPPPTTGTPVQPEPTEGRRTRWIIVLLLVLLGIAAVTAAVVATRGGDEEPEPPSDGQVVRIRESDYVGRPVDEVADELGDLGFEVTTTEVANPGERRENYVSSVDPNGRLPEGSEVEVSFWGPQPEEEEASEEPTPTESEEPDPTPSETPTESEEPSPSPTPTPSPTPSRTPSPTPSASLSPSATTSQPAAGQSSPAAADTPQTDREVAPR